ncbi:MAG: hypothetical protein N5P05_003188 [Chroococcopsis gigantea SAG 12.99]|nr:hypothetical protein [Chroococcopsis gigantea SAG 12.99]
MNSPALTAPSANVPNCGESLKVEGGTFQTLTPPGTIDVEAVEIPYQGLED